jgi:hypothetical protein
MSTGIMLLLALTLSAASGIAATAALLPRRRGDGRLAAKIVLGTLLGAWISSVTFLAVLMVGGAALGTTVGFDVLAVLAAVLLYVGTRRLHATHPPELVEGPPRGVASLAWLAPLLLVAWLALQTTLPFAAAHPHGQWDAWSNWNLKARHFALGGDRWFDVYDPSMSGHWHDYPLWLPLSLSRMWTYAMTTDAWVGGVLSVAAVVMVALLLLTGLRAMRGMTHACIAVIVLLTSESLLRWGGSQYADIPLSMFMLGSLIALCLGLSDARRAPAWWIMAGLLAGAAVCTKHEGKLFCLALVVTAGMATWRVAGLKPAAKRIGVMVLAMLPGVGITAGFNMLIDAEGAQFFGATTWSMLTDPSRHAMVLREIGNIAPLVFDWRVLVVAVLYALAAGLNRHRSQRVAALMCLVTVAMLAAGYYATVITTRLDLYTHITTSADRLMVQLWSPLLLGVFLLLRTPEELRQVVHEPEGDIEQPQH